MQKLVKLKEETERGPVIHAEAPFGADYTLCGCAPEGENGDEPLVIVNLGKITCPDCLTIIRYCKNIPSCALA